MTKKQNLFFFLILLLSVGLRVSLVLVNTEANDNHMEVVDKIIQQGRLPDKDECWECFQPKLFHWAAAMFLKKIEVTDPGQQVLLTQWLNFMTSMVMLWFLWKFIQSFDIFDDEQKLISFGLAALNPVLIGINVQATNDTFVITFSIISMYFAHRLIDRKAPFSLFLCILFSALTILAKTNGAITVLAIGLTFLFEALAQRNFYPPWRKNKIFIAGVYGLSVLILAFLGPTSQFVSSIQKYGSPVTINISVPDHSFPEFFNKTETYKPGILSIQDGFFTFKLPELLIDPQITTGNKNYPSHRTSFWTILYGRANFAQYSQWPPSWVTSSSSIRMLGRIIYLLAIFPTLAILLGTLLEARKLLDWLRKGASAVLPPSSAGLYMVSWLMFLAFEIVYALMYRRYDVIKAIFVFPAIPALVVLFRLGWHQVEIWFSGKVPWLRLFLRIAMVLLIGLYALDALVLFIQLL